MGNNRVCKPDKNKSAGNNKHKGVTVVELMMAVAILGIIMPVLVILLTTVTGGFTGYEATLSLKKNNQASLNRIFIRLGSCKRLFQRAETDYLAAVNLAGAPALLAGSQLPVIQSAGSLSFGTSNYAPVNYGNSLLFASNEGSLSLVISTSTTKKIDYYQFNYFYLTSENPNTTRAAPSYRLVEWRSIKYADLTQIISIGDATLRGQVIDAVIAEGITFAWDSSSAVLSNAFAQLTAGGYSPIGSHAIPSLKVTVLTDILTNIIGGYRYGISSNSSGWAATPKTVPVYATANGNFPAGFEVGIVGSTSGRKVLLRSVLIADGAFKGMIGEEQQLAASARDLW